MREKMVLESFQKNSGEKLDSGQNSISFFDTTRVPPKITNQNMEDRLSNVVRTIQVETVGVNGVAGNLVVNTPPTDIGEQCQK